MGLLQIARLDVAGAFFFGVSRWKGYGPANPNVRPDVPKRVPVTWFPRLAKFLGRQK